jgi:hypothetical protein
VALRDVAIRDDFDDLIRAVDDRNLTAVVAAINLAASVVLDCAQALRLIFSSMRTAVLNGSYYPFRWIWVAPTLDSCKRSASWHL